MSDFSRWLQNYLGSQPSHGLVGSPNNFGATGKNPTHPELLDWLASEFMAKGWSLKQLHRLIMTSETYRRDSKHPDVDQLAKLDSGDNSYAVFLPREEYSIAVVP